MSAFQALGPFISTFASPATTGLYFDEDGILQVIKTTDEIKPENKPTPVIESKEPAETQSNTAPVSTPSARYKICKKYLLS